MKTQQNDMISWVNTPGLRKAVLVLPAWSSEWNPFDKFGELNNLNSAIFRINKASLLERFLHKSNLILRPEEVDRSHQFRNEKAKRKYLCGRIGIRLLLSKLLDKDPFSIRFSRNRWGKPALKDESLAFNISHTGQWLVIAISNQQKVGVDIEKINPIFDYRLLVESYFHSAEKKKMTASFAFQHRKFFQLWTRKEALAKVIGLGLHERFLSINMLDEAFPKPELNNSSFFVIHSFHLDRQHIGALALRNSVEIPTFYDFL